jgi:NAD(P)H-hydrate epimerase
MLDRAGAIAHDRAAIERLGLPGIAMMEVAAATTAAVLLARLDRGWPHPDATHPALLLCGPGNNGGDGYGIARHLLNAGVPVVVLALGTPPAGSDAAIERGVLERMGVPIGDASSAGAWPATPALVVDALFGTGLGRPLEGGAAEAVERANRLAVPILAVDLPSGIDADGGPPRGAAIRATLTCTMAAPKPVLFDLDAQPWIGLVEVVPIGTPAALLAEFGRPLPHRAKGDARRAAANPPQPPPRGGE